MRWVGVAVLAALTLVGCVKHRPPGAEAPPRPAVRPTLARHWSEIGPDAYPELNEGPASVASLREGHDTGRWTVTQQRWGALRVLQFEDTDRPTTEQGAVAAWVLGDEVVDAVILRDFLGAPTADSPEALLLGLGEVWPPPWVLCRPRNEASSDVVVAVDEAGRTELGLVPSEKDGAVWTVDHVDFLAAGLSPERWFERKEYGGCEELGTLLENGRIKAPRPDKAEKPDVAAEP